VLKKDSRNSDEESVPDVLADNPEGTMERFTLGLRRVLTVQKQSISAPRRSPARKKRSRSRRGS